ncbi:ComE operon protein 1 [mine drainage metagenome]|uniref:ComE operon protein 1 n=1 Tax=mine drainage metagenome TaxID=410659 RepID=A0A1J5QMR9_9ZZZZ
MKKLILVLIACLALAVNAFAAVNINTATQSELEAVSGIGPSKAKAIIDYRTKSGPFKSVDDLDKVKGFGKKSVDKLRNDISVNGTGPTKAVGKPAKTDEKKQ